MRQRTRRYDDSRGGCRDKVADREEGGTGEAAAETRSASTASTGECEIPYSDILACTQSGMIYRFVDTINGDEALLYYMLLRCNARLKLRINRRTLSRITAAISKRG